MSSQQAWMVMLFVFVYFLTTVCATSWYDIPHRTVPKVMVTVMQGTNVDEVIQSQLQHMFAHERAQDRKHTMMKEEENDKVRKTTFVLYFYVVGAACVIHLIALLRRKQLAAKKKSRRKKQDTKIMNTNPSLMTANENEMEEDDEKDDDDDKSLWGMLLKDKIFEVEN